MSKFPVGKYKVRARTRHRKLVSYEVIDTETKTTHDAFFLDAHHTRDSALSAARRKCAELNDTQLSEASNVQIHVDPSETDK